YFLEVNTRLQVEHPVTEMVTGVDIVHAQLRIAAGERLDWTPPSLRGHAVEARLYAEDPENDFAPALGTLLAYQQPHLPGVRFDSGVEAGSVITHHYDPMIAKVIAHASDRPTAIHRLTSALEQTVALGVRTNQAFLIELLRHPVFVEGALHTRFLEEHPIGGSEPPLPKEVLLTLALLEPLLQGKSQANTPRDRRDPTPSSPWERFGRWRIGL
ncbi:MAG: 3-methylcrotonyl-CoA carboxylase, partial [Fimbriimonadales bacterium]